jgi:phosphonate transport system substrate-binding protein
MKREAGPLVLGAVAYDAKVVTIWDGFREWFGERGLPFDYVLFTNYERQVEAHFGGTVHVAWNSPLAWIESLRLAKARKRKPQALAMRDTDCDLTSVIVVPSKSPARKLADLRGKRIGVGAQDSPQATLIPLLALAEAGLEPGRDVEVVHHDVLLGKHGDHIGGERDAFACLERGEAQACAMLDLNWDAWLADGTIDREAFAVVGETDRFDHCVFTVRQDLDLAAERAWLDALFAMQYSNPAHRDMMDLEGLKAWLPGRTTGFGPLTAAVESERFFTQAER